MKLHKYNICEFLYNLEVKKSLLRLKILEQ